MRLMRLLIFFISLWIHFLMLYGISQSLDLTPADTRTPIPEQTTLTIAEIEKRALEQSLQLHMPEYSITQAQRMVDQAKSAFYPRISIQSAYSGNLLQPDKFFDNKMSNDLIFDWDFFQNGTLLIQQSEAQTQLAIAQLRQDSSFKTFRFSLRQLILQAAYAQELITIKKVFLDRKTRYYDMQKELHDTGKISALDLIEASSQYDVAEAAYTTACVNFELALMKIKYISGCDTLSHIDISTLQPCSNIILLESCISAAQKMNNEVKMADHMKQMADKAYTYSKLKRLPQLSLFTGSAFALDDLGTQQDKLQFRTGFIVRYPLFDAGTIRRGIQTAQDQAKEAAINYEIKRYELNITLREKYYHYQATRTLFDAYKKRYTFFTDDYTQAKNDFEQHLIPLNEWLSREEAYHQAKERWLTLFIDLLLSEAALAYEVGVSDIHELSAN